MPFKFNIGDRVHHFARGFNFTGTILSREVERQTERWNGGPRYYCKADDDWLLTVPECNRKMYSFYWLYEEKIELL